MADGANAGSVYVEVNPDAANFWAKFRAQTLGQAPKTGDDLGDAMGKRIADQIAKGIRDGLGKAPKGPATRSGTESGGAFADGFKKRVEAALKALPKATIDGDSTPAQRAVAELRAEIESLSSKTIGVNIGGAEARAEMDRLIAKADELGAKHPEIQASTDLARASAEMAAFNAEIDRIDGRTAKVDVDTTSAVGNISNLVAAGISLGPALVPAAAAAAAAIGGIGPAAVGALGGLGVLTFAVSGVAGTLKAMQKAHDAASKGAAAQATANKKLAESMKDLSPAGQEFARFVFSLKAPLLDLRRTAEAGVLPGLEDGIKSMLTVMPTAINLTGRFAASVGNMARETGKAFSQPYWVTFANQLTDTAIPAVENMGRVAYNLVLGASGLVKAFLPLSGDIGGGLLRFSQQFAQYALNLQNTQGFRQFLDYVRGVGPQVVQTIGEVAQAAFRIVQAAAPLGGVSLTAIRLFAEAINALPVGVLTAAVTAIASLVTANKALNLINPEVAGGQRLFATVLDASRTSMGNAAESAGGLSRSLTGVKAGAGAVMALMGGPWGIALGAAALALGAFAQEAADNKQKIESLQSSAASYARTLRDGVTPASAAAAADILKQNESLRGLVDASRQAGISQADLVKGLNGDAAVRQIVIDRLNDQIRNEKVLASEARAGSDAETVASQKHVDRAAALEQMRIAFAKTNTENAEANRLTVELTREQQQATVATGALTPAQERLGLTAQAVGVAQQSLGEALRTVSSASATATERSNALKAADDAVFSSVRNAITAEQDQALVLLQVADAGKRNADQQLFGKATLDLHSDASIRNRQMLEQRFLALGQQYLADVQAGVAVAEASKKHDTNRDALIKAANAAGFDTGEVNKLAHAFGTLPTDPRIQVSVLGVAEAMNKLETAQIAEFGLRNGLNPAEARRQYNQQKDPLRRAEGGAVFGPGGPTDDKIPAWLSNGEHVLTAAEVRAAGGHASIEAFRKRLLSGSVMLPPGYASGGPVARPASQPRLSVEWPFRFPMKVKIPPPSASGGGESFGNWPASPSAQRGDSGVWRRVVDLIRSTGPLSGAFGNAYRPGDPLWHGSGRAVDWMGFNQDALATFLASRRPLELIHRTGRRDYAYTRGRNMGSFDQGLMEQHRNHVHIAMAKGGPVERGRQLHVGRYDSGGVLPPGLTMAHNDTGRNEFVFTGDQLASLGGGPTITQNVYPQPGQSEREIAAAASRQIAWDLVTTRAGGNR